MKTPVSCIFAVLLFLMPLCLYAAGSGGKSALERGIAEYKAENYEEALELLKTARQERPDSSVAAFYLGLTYKQTGNYREAAMHYRDAIRLVPPVNDAYTELIEVLYNLNELKEAKEWIAKAEEKGIRPGQVAFLKGMVLLKENSTREAVGAFKKAKELDKSLEQPSDLQIAMAYAKEKRMEQARESLKSAIALDPTSELARFAKEYENAFLRSMEEYKKWRLTAGVSYQYDDNVILKPLAFISPNFEESVQKGGGKHDNAMITTAGIEYSPLLQGPWLLSIQYNLNNILYSKITKLNVFTQSLSLNPGYNFQQGAVVVPLSYNYAWLHGNRYLDLAIAKPQVNVLLAPGHIGQFSAGYAKRHMMQTIDRDEDRSADLYSVSAGYFYQFSEGRGLFNLQYEFIREDTKGINWANNGNRINSTLLVPLFTKMNVLLSGEAFLQDYTKINSFTGPRAPVGFPTVPGKRRDRTYSGSATIIRELLKGLNLNLQYSHTRADSNFAIYDYTRNQYTAGIEYIF